jgi:hypothetical protein
MTGAERINPAIFDAVLGAKLKGSEPLVVLQPEVVPLANGERVWLADGRFQTHIKGIMDDRQSAEALIGFLRHVADHMEDHLYG